MPLREDIQKLSGEEIINLYVLDFSRLEIPLEYRFVPYTEDLGASNIVFGGETFSPMNIIASGFDYNAEGAFPKPTLQVANVFNVFSDLNTRFNDMVGAELTRIKTFAKYLDNGSEPNAEDYLAKDVYRIDRKVQQNKVFCEYELCSRIDQEGIQIPKRIFQRDICSYTYRRWEPVSETFDYKDVTCPYAGALTYDENGDRCSDAEDKCSKKLESGCFVRFPREPLPFLGFPGLGDTPV
tara:strand:- start:57 stop:773 length:717 start_codon:yes stop_codon:yes gene_type:complete